MNKLVLSLQIVLLVCVVYLIARFFEQSNRIADRFQALEMKVQELSTASEGATAPAGNAVKTGQRLAVLETRIARVDERVGEVLTALEWLAIDIDASKRYTWDILQAVQSSGEFPGVEMPAEYEELFNPATRAKLVELAAKKGVRLLEDRVEVPGVLIQNRAMLEFFAVISGGKEHEGVVALTGNYKRGGAKPVEGLASVINACILGLGYEAGKPVRFEQGKVLPAEGETIQVYLEWEGDGEKVRAHAEDLVYNIEKQASMARNKWVYVGSRFERDFATGDVVYLAEITGDVVATYSWPNTIIDNTTSEGSDDIYYTCLTPRLPEIGTEVTLVLSREELPAKEFPPLVFRQEGEGEDEGEDGAGGK